MKFSAFLVYITNRFRQIFSRIIKLMNASVQDKVKKLNKQTAKSVKKLLKFCEKHNVEVELGIDEEDSTNMGTFFNYVTGPQIIRLSPKLFDSSEVELLSIFLHEVGHMDQFINHFQEIKDNFPGVMSITAEEQVTKKWKTKTQKYWIDYVGLEQDAWVRGYNIAKKLKIEINIDQWTRIRLSCLRRAGAWFAGTFK